MMTKDRFVKIIKEMEKASKTYDAIVDTIQLSPDNLMSELILKGQDRMAILLEEVFGNRDEAIQWYIYTTNFGKRNYNITLEDGTELQITSASRLYDYLVRA